MRPIYENAQTKLDETNAAQKIANFLSVSLEKQSIAYRIDYKLLSGGDHVGLLEYKRRKFTYGKYPDVMLSEHKYKEGMRLAKKHNIPFIFAVELDDGIYLAEMEKGYPVTFSGRTVQTRDKWDVENVVHVPMSKFKLMGK